MRYVEPLKRSEHEVYEFDEDLCRGCPVDRLIFEQWSNSRKCRPGDELPKVYDASVPRERQIALAQSAAPAEVSSKATVYILGPRGDEKVREGTNGFSCFVGRHFVKPEKQPRKRRSSQRASTPKAAGLILLVYLRR